MMMNLNATTMKFREQAIRIMEKLYEQYVLQQVSKYL